MRCLFLSIFMLVTALPLNAQTDTLLHIPADSISRLTISADSDSVYVAADSPAIDSAEISGSMAVDLMRQSQTADMEASMRESILTEQLNSAENARQRRLIEEQINELYRSDSLRRAEQQSMIDSLKLVTPGAPVTLKHDTLYYIYTTLGSFTAKERAKLNSRKILETARMFSLKSDSLFLIDGNATSDIMYRENILASVTDNDAMWMGMPRDELARKYIDEIMVAVAAFKKSVSVWNIVKMISFCILLIGSVYALFRGTRYLFNRIVKRLIISHKDKWFKGLKIKNLEVLNQHRELQLMLAVAKAVKWIVYFLIFYFSIPILFSIFPTTKHIADTIFNWILNPVKGMLLSLWEFLPDLFRIVITIVVVRYIIKFMKYVAREIEAGNLVIPGFYPDWTKSTLTILKIFVYVFAIIIIFPLLPGSESPVFKGVSAFMGLIVSLGSTGVISNLMAGLVITYMRPFVKGDRIRIGDTVGDVIEKTPFVIRVQTIKNEVITVPNSAVLSANVVNYSAKSKDLGLIVNTMVTMGYEVPWERVNELLLEAASRTVMLESSPAPFVLQISLNDFSVSYQINAYTQEPTRQAVIYSDLHKNIQDVCREAGIELIMPHYQAIRDGNAPVIPQEYNGKEGVYRHPTPKSVMKDARQKIAGEDAAGTDSDADTEVADIRK